jgi:hypothetical protein
VLSGTSLDPSELRYVFKMVKKLLPAANAQTNGTGEPSEDYVGVGDYHVMSFDMSDVADFNVNNVVLDRSQAKAQNGTSAFRTDTDISGNTALRERDLQKWEPSEVDPNLSLESGGRSADWDQFSTNERLFGVKSNYDETFYTTTINRNDPQYASKAARAEKIAREIESSSALNSHVREERGANAATEEGGDEEDKYSGVRRETPNLSSNQPNRYTPPARRAPTAQATVPGAPVDPAIISASITRPGSTSSQAQRTASPATVKPAAPEASKAGVSGEPSAAGTKPDTKPSVTARPSAEQPQKPRPMAMVGAIPPRKTTRPHDATTNVENDLLDSFKQFSAAEKLRISDRQRSIARENKAVKLNDLKKFALNFKLSTPVPQDLVPILAKDENKQAAIVERALRQVEETKSTPPKTVSTVTDTKPASRPAAAKPDSTHPSPSSGAPRPRSNQPAHASATMRDRPYQNINQGPPRSQLSNRLAQNHAQHKQQGQQGGMPYYPNPQPIPSQDMRIPPSGPSQSSSGAQTPTSSASTRFNVRAHEFKPNPAANTFQPGGTPSTNSSPRPDSSSKQEHRRPIPTTSLFGGQPAPARSIEDMNKFNAVARMQKEADDRRKDKTNAANFPLPYWTPPTWDFPTANDKGYVHMFENAATPAPVSAPHNAASNGPYQQQLPLHVQGPQSVPQGQTPQHTPRGPPVQAHHPQSHHYENQHMQFSHSNSSVQPSPRSMQPYAYNTQPQQMSGYPSQVQMPQYGMSPNVQHVALRNVQPGQFVPPGPSMGGHMMTSQNSSGPYMGMPGNPQMQMYSPAPGPAFPNYSGHMAGGPGGNGGYPNSPRPGAPMMSHQGSQQGHQQPPMMYMPPGAQGPPHMFQVPPGSSKSMPLTLCRPY